MRIGLYGMPTAGKTHIMDRISFLDVLVGSRLLREYDPDFDIRDEAGRERDRKDVAKLMLARDNFIMDGHYAFGDEIAFTDEEGEMYDIYLYLYIDPIVIRRRMENSPKNQKYLKYDLEAWQKTEINGLREYCHKHCKDFYVIDNQPGNSSEDTDTVIEFIRDISEGYSCAAFARECVNAILDHCPEETIFLTDGDKTLIIEDSSRVFLNYKTSIYDGNFYTGYQSWKQDREFKAYPEPKVDVSNVHFNDYVLNGMHPPIYILTSGHKRIWDALSKEVSIPVFAGIQVSAETKMYITKLLQQAGKYIVAFGDGMSDYYMLKQADEGYLIAKDDGSVSRSLRGINLEGIKIVYA